MFEERPKNRLSPREKLKIAIVCSVGAVFWGVALVGAIQGLMQSL